MRRLTAIFAMSAGLLGALALSAPAGAQASGTVKYWGSSDGGVFRIASPHGAALPKSIKQVATSNGAWYAVTTTGAVWAWGAGQHGQLGDGNTTSTLKAVKVTFPAGVKIAFMADTSPYDTALAVDSTGHAWGWGYDSSGQLCKGGTPLETKPVKLKFSDVTALSGAGDHALYVAGGTLFACGDNGHGDLGVGTTKPSHVPVTVPLTGVSAVTSSWRNSGALVGGTYYSWGYDAMGTVGNGATTDALSPVKVSLPAEVTSVRLGGGGPKDGQTLALLSDGTMWAWGADTDGQLGDGGSTFKTTPEHVTTPASYVAVESNGESSYAIDSSGRLWGWGSDHHDQLGNGSADNQLTPAVLESGVGAVSATATDAVVLF